MFLCGWERDRNEGEILALSGITVWANGNIDKGEKKGFPLTQVRIYTYPVLELYWFEGNGDLVENLIYDLITM